MRTVIKMDSQQLTGIERCPQYYYLAFEESLEPRAEYKSKALTKGSSMGLALEVYYKEKMAGKGFEDCMSLGAAEINNTEFTDAPGEPALDQKLLILTKFLQYCGFYRSEREWPVAVECGFSFTLYEDDALTILYEGKPDLVVENPRGSSVLYPFDHKTESRRNELHGFSNQFLGYAWALKSDKLVVNYVGLQKGYKPEESFLRSLHRYTKEDLTDWRDNAIESIKSVLQYKESGRWPKRRAACDTKYGACRFSKLCDTQFEWTRSMRKEQFFQIRKEPWTPWV